jgi:hypothetical protein
MSAARSTMDRELVWTAARRGERVRLDEDRCGHRGRPWQRGTVFDCSSEELGIDPGLTFDKKLAELQAKGKISVDERDTLRVLVDAGSAAAHRGWRPEIEELNTMMDVVETFLHRTFTLDDGIKKLKAAVPARSKSKS